MALDVHRIMVENERMSLNDNSVIFLQIINQSSGLLQDVQSHFVQPVSLYVLRSNKLGIFLNEPICHEDILSSPLLGMIREN